MLSRAYLNETVEDVPLKDDIEVMVHSFIQEIPASPEILKQLKEERWSTTGTKNTDSRRFPNAQKGLQTHSHAILEY